MFPQLLIICHGEVQCKVLIVPRTCGSAVKFQSVPSSSVAIDSRMSPPPQYPLIHDSCGKEDRSPRPGAWGDEK